VVVQITKLDFQWNSTIEKAATNFVENRGDAEVLVKAI